MNFETILRVGDVFTTVYRSKPRSEAERHTEEWIDFDHHPVHLEIRSISFFGRRISELDPGFTARLELAGTGMEQVGEKMILGVLSE